MDKEYWMWLAASLGVALLAMMVLNYRLTRLLHKSIKLLNEITNRKE